MQIKQNIKTSLGTIRERRCILGRGGIAESDTPSIEKHGAKGRGDQTIRKGMGHV